METDLAAAKQACREELVIARHSLTDAERAEQAFKLGQNIAAFLDAKKIPDGATIAVYNGLPEELSLVPTCALLYAHGMRVCYPCVHTFDRMEFYALTPAQLDAGPEFLTKPNRLFPEESCAEYELVRPEEIGIMLIPGLGFDRDRNRIGYGAGCYDRYLARVPKSCMLVGVCFDIQLMEEVPHGPTDQPLDYIISPTVAY